MSNKRTNNINRKRIVVRLVSAGIISFSIGFIFMYLACPSCSIKLSNILYNGGYSLFLGYGLFSFGFVFAWIENRYVSWITKPVKSLLIVLLFSALYSSVVIMGVNYIWHTLIGKMSFAHFIDQYGYVMWIEFIIFYFIALWFYARSFFFEWRTEVQNKEILKREALQLQYESLKTQVNPHFLFNSLNALTSLIDIDTSSAKKFTVELSAFYRDILQLKDKELITLDEELEILKRYLYLQNIRFGEKFSFIIEADAGSKAMVIPLSVQMLVENVFKHNIISGDQRLDIKIEMNHHDLVISNTYLPKLSKEHSTGLGLSNLYERILYLTGKKLFFGVDNDKYIVKLPLIYLNDEDTVG
ncbi:sensor histidine kinase [Carboxylicivirga caseinilyticus]|uniref:sensor histidine kinase n=1 Tax=Carboxylicivirga caseinilyticus TaxID=3417572 RepID=UPI003D342297|nr:histidine kinase [Marinilabiliaceae bacterium A049]